MAQQRLDLRVCIRGPCMRRLHSSPHIPLPVHRFRPPQFPTTQASWVVASAAHAHSIMWAYRRASAHACRHAALTILSTAECSKFCRELRFSSIISNVVLSRFLVFVRVSEWSQMRSLGTVSRMPFGRWNQTTPCSGGIFKVFIYMIYMVPPGI